MRITHRSSRRLSAGAAVLLAASIGACGSSGGGTAAPATTAKAAAAHTADAASVCGDVLKIDSTPSPDGGPNDTPPPADVKAYGTKIVPLVDDIIAKGPAELKAPGTLAKKVFETMATTGKTDGENDPLFQQAGNTVEAWVHKNCGYQNVDVTAVDFGFQGLPTTLKAGRTSIAILNKSSHGEQHVLLFAQGRGGAALTAHQVMTTAPDKLFAMLDILPGGAFAGPGQTGGGVFDLKPGHYVVLCPIGDPPHFMKGMVVDVTVT